MRLDLEDIDLLEANGWTITCESPFEITHEDGSFASNLAAQYAVDGILSDLRADNNLLNNIDSTNITYDAYTMLLETVGKLNLVFNQALHAKNERSWETAYDLIFSQYGNQTITKCLNALNIERFDYYDPDTTYEEDSTAYMSALNSYMLHIAAFKDALPNVQISTGLSY